MGWGETEAELPRTELMGWGEFFSKSLKNRWKILQRVAGKGVEGKGCSFNTRQAQTFQYMSQQQQSAAVLFSEELTSTANEWRRISIVGQMCVPLRSVTQIAPGT
jgi:hypothetical protein